MLQFIKFMLATFFGIILFITFSFVALVGWSLAMADGSPEIKDKSVLKINLARAIAEKAADDESNPLNDLEIPYLAQSPMPLGLVELKKAIAEAKDDSRIKGIYLEASAVGAGYAMLQELRNSLLDFKKSGKFIYAYSEFYEEKAYFIVSVADRIFLNPQGILEFNGLAAEVTFYKSMFEKIGVKPEIFRVGDYKSAVEPYFLDKMSDANRLQTQSYLNSIYNHYLKQVSESRKIPVGALEDISDKMKIKLANNANDALQHKLITDIGYYDEFEAELKKACGLEEKEKISFVGFNTYQKAEKEGVKNNYAKNKIAVIVAEGVIMGGKNSDGIVGSETIMAELRKARKDSSVKAVVLRINSPGGSALASDLMWREIQLTKKVKPVYASMSDVAASGGYYMAMGCDRIFAQPNTITGSIGIFAVLYNPEELLTNKIGLSFDTVKTGEYSDFPNLTRTMSDVEKTMFQDMVNEGYEEFTKKAAEGRKMSHDSLKTLASGRVWTGEQALANGLIDELGGLEETIKAAAKAAKLKDDDYAPRYFPIEKTFMEQLLGNSMSQMRENAIKQELGALYPYYKQVKNLENLKGIQARMPFEFVIR